MGRQESEMTWELVEVPDCLYFLNNLEKSSQGLKIEKGTRGLQRGKVMKESSRGGGRMNGLLLEVYNQDFGDPVSMVIFLSSNS